MKNTILRGKILKLLSDMYPDGIEHTSLVGIYHSYEKVDDITRSVEYLVDKKLVDKKETPHPYRENTFVTYYKITPAGIDLIEGTSSPDSGIIIPLEA